MALSLSKSYTFSPSTTIASSEVNTDLDTLYNAFSGLEAGTSSMSKLPLDADPTSALYAATKQYVDAYANYRRPNLTWISITTVDVANNTTTANQTKIIFPDGNYRSVTEDTSSTTKYRRFDITATAEFTSGTEDSGVRSGISEANNTWYAIYAVKSTINTSNFVLVGDTTLPTQANAATLNGRYATNGWVYLGLIRNGDNGGTAADLLKFVQSGNMTMLYNVATGQSSTSVMNGTILATASVAAASLAWTYASGTGAAQVPSIVDMGVIAGTASGGPATITIREQATATNLVAARDNLGRLLTHIIQGITLLPNANGVMDILLVGFVDRVLGVGSNPLV